MRARMVVVVVVAAVAPLMGCDLTPEGAAERPPTDAPVTIDVDRLGPAEILVWVETPEVVTPLTRAFEREHPGIDVRIVTKSYEDLLNTAKLALSSDRAPDVITVDQGPGSMGELVRGGLLRPLDRYAEAYGWARTIPPALMEINSISDDGTRIGSGSLYGVSEFGELIGLYYNRAKLRSLGLPLPTTFAELDALVPRIRAAGEVPIQFGNQDRVLGELMLQALANVFGGDAATHALAYGRAGASYAGGAFERAAETLRRWALTGAFPSGFAGMDETGAERAFCAGEGVFYLAGSWATPVVARALGDDAGFIALPGARGAAPVTGGPSLPFGITARSDQPDAAAAWIDFMTGPRHTKLARQLRQLPAALVDVEPGARSVFADVERVWSEANADGRVVPYLNYATPRVNVLLAATVQELLGGRVTPTEVVERLQQDYDSATG